MIQKYESYIRLKSDTIKNHI